MAYTTTTRATLRTRVTERLITNFWSTSEINAYIAEALRVWNVLTGYERDVYSSVAVIPSQQSYSLSAMTGGSSDPLFILRIESATDLTTFGTIDLRILSHYVPTWFSETSTTIQNWSHIGQNNVVLYPKSTSSLLLNVYTVDRAQVPTGDASTIQISEEDMPAIIDYCTFIARLKESGSEFQESIGLLQNFLKAAARYNSMILQTSLYRKVMGTPFQARQRPDATAHVPPR